MASAAVPTSALGRSSSGTPLGSQFSNISTDEENIKHLKTKFQSLEEASSSSVHIDVEKFDDSYNPLYAFSDDDT